MNEDMVERVARALCAKHIADLGEGSAGDTPDGLVQDMDETPVPFWTLFADDARAAIEAMREPSAGMVRAGFRHGYLRHHSDRGVWRVMIDAALGKD